MKYDVILADPPWRYSFSRSKSREIENKYPTMTQADLCALKIPAAKNSVLYLWATAPKLPEALEVMAAWGFKYKTHAVWDKVNIGMGYWFRGQHELLLVGVRGKMSPPAPDKRIGSVLWWPRRKHSQKPDFVRHHIRAAHPEARCVELFAREAAPGWDAIGDEIDGRDIREVLSAVGD